MKVVMDSKPADLSIESTHANESIKSRNLGKKTVKDFQ